MRQRLRLRRADRTRRYAAVVAGIAGLMMLVGSSQAFDRKAESALEKRATVELK
jgi:hypothetical protein